MKDRIQVDGVWYVREDIPEEELERDATDYIGVVWETDDWCFDATKLVKEDGTMYDDEISVEATHKVGEKKDWVTEHWDNIKWLRHVHNRESETLDSILKDYDNTTVRQIQIFADILHEKGWL